eukprot:scaffold75894_cov35-Tisochrysis_lutea.AAC.2
MCDERRCAAVGRPPSCARSLLVDTRAVVVDGGPHGKNDRAQLVEDLFHLHRPCPPRGEQTDLHPVPQLCEAAEHSPVAALADVVELRACVDDGGEQCPPALTRLGPLLPAQLERGGHALRRGCRLAAAG